MYKIDYEPLLSAGRHEMTPSAFESRFVIGLEGFARRQIWDRFKYSILDKIEQLKIPCEVWVDGSFVTRCVEPDDIDASIMVLSEVIDSLDDDSLSFLKLFDDFDPKFHETLDVFLCPVYPIGHPLRFDVNDPDGWAKQWSSERNSGWLKGFVVIPFR